MEGLTEAIISLFNLAEAEGRLLKKKVIQTAIIILMFIVSTLFVLAALGFLLAAIYQFLILYLEITWVLLIMGSICLIIFGITLWLARSTNHKL